MTTDHTAPAAGTTGNLLIDYWDRMPAAIASVVDDPLPVKEVGNFSPGFLLPDLDDDVRRFLGVAGVGWAPLAEYGGHALHLLDLTRNPGTHTTKTFPSLLIVARAVEYIRRTGERIVVFSPTSANKGTALRDAVERAIDAGLVTPDQLRIVVLAPAGCLPKLRGSRLSEDPELRALNPVLTYDGPEPEDVKALGRAFAAAHAGAVADRLGANLWFSLELRNYLVADTARAFFERDACPTGGGARRRVHAHAVSSAFGLLGYHRGREILEATGLADAADRPASLLVQHLGTPDMVLNLRTGDFARSGLPDYRRDADGRYRQDADPHYPAVTDDPGEVLDPTFYTHRPVTSESMNALISRFGGDGIVVSRRECEERYPVLRDWLAPTSRPLPADLAELREWSLVMALTGVTGAVDRGLVETGADIVVHGSGSYSTSDYTPLPASSTTPVADVDAVAAAVLAAPGAA